MDCASWWLDHVGETYVYVLATRAGDPGMQATSIDRLLNGARDWGSLIDVPQASGLMNDHVLIMKHLADSAFGHDQEGADRAIDGLILNMDRQGDLYQRQVPNFPTDEWRKLFETHLQATGGYILALSAGDIPDFKAKYGQALTNRNHLARLWGRTAFQIGRS